MNVCVLKPEWAHPSFTVLNRHRWLCCKQAWWEGVSQCSCSSWAGECSWSLTHGGQREMSGSYWITLEAQAGRQDRALSVPCSPDRKLPVFYRLSLLPLSALTSPRPAGLVTFTLKKNGTGPAGIKTHRHKHPLLEQNLNLIQKQYGHCSGMHR